MHTIDPRLKILYPTAFGILTILLDSQLMLVGVLRNTSTMAMVADARGFGANKRRTSVREHRRSTADVLGYGSWGSS